MRDSKECGMSFHDYAPLKEPALIGVSGGRDSVALLHLLVSRGHRLIVCHLDHALRAESREDARFVEKMAVRLSCECVVRRENVAARAKRMKSCAGQLCGRCNLIIVFISTTRAATLTSFSRSVSNRAVRQLDRFGIETRRPHISQ